MVAGAYEATWAGRWCSKSIRTVRCKVCRNRDGWKVRSRTKMLLWKNLKKRICIMQTLSHLSGFIDSPKNRRNEYKGRHKWACNGDGFCTLSNPESGDTGFLDIDNP